MRVTLHGVANRPPEWLRTATDNYLKRLPRAWQCQLDLIPPSRRRATAAERMADEWQQLAKRWRDDDVIVLLDERGAAHSSRQLAGFVGEWQREGRHVRVVIGGPDGIAEAGYARAHARWSVSPMTLPHELARLILVEQLYRAHTLIEGHPYHRD
ncbi:MAG: 23S rRNA (pseudouridine(1915)-N(3))-methyltransferase RlmH [Pseudomonadota bacterium]